MRCHDRQLICRLFADKANLVFPAQSGKKRVLLYFKIFAARANVSMRQSQEGGLQTRPYKFLFFFAYFAFFAVK
jgi:hypothetical protein